MRVIAAESRRSSRSRLPSRSTSQGIGAAIASAKRTSVAGAPGVLGHPIDEIRVHRHPGVSRHRPGGGRPGEEMEPRRRRPGPARLGREGLARAHRKEHPDRRILDVLVVLRHLVRRERGAAAGAVGLALVALVEEPLVVELAERRPDRLDVLVRVGEVGVVEIDPVAEALGHRAPLPLVGHHRVEAGAVEGGDRGRAVAGDELLDVLLAGEAQPLLDLDLDRQPVGVPTRLARDELAAHGLEAREEVLDDARDDVTDVRRVVGGRRPLEEDGRAPYSTPRPGARTRRESARRSAPRARRRGLRARARGTDSPRGPAGRASRSCRRQGFVEAADHLGEARRCLGVGQDAGALDHLELRLGQRVQPDGRRTRPPGGPPGGPRRPGSEHGRA